MGPLVVAAMSAAAADATSRHALQPREPMPGDTSRSPRPPVDHHVTGSNVPIGVVVATVAGAPPSLPAPSEGQNVDASDKRTGQLAEGEQGGIVEGAAQHQEPPAESTDSALAGAALPAATTAATNPNAVGGSTDEQLSVAESALPDTADEGTGTEGRAGPGTGTGADDNSGTGENDAATQVSTVAEHVATGAAAAHAEVAVHGATGVASAPTEAGDTLEQEREVVGVQGGSDTLLPGAHPGAGSGDGCAASELKGRAIAPAVSFAVPEAHAAGSMDAGAIQGLRQGDKGASSTSLLGDRGSDGANPVAAATAPPLHQSSRAASMSSVCSSVAPSVGGDTRCNSRLDFLPGDGKDGEQEVVQEGAEDSHHHHHHHHHRRRHHATLPMPVTEPDGRAGQAAEGTPGAGGQGADGVQEAGLQVLDGSTSAQGRHEELASGADSVLAVGEGGQQEGMPAETEETPSGPLGSGVDTAVGEPGTVVAVAAESSAAGEAGEEAGQSSAALQGATGPAAVADNNEGSALATGSGEAMDALRCTAEQPTAATAVAAAASTVQVAVDAGGDAGAPVGVLEGTGGGELERQAACPEAPAVPGLRQEQHEAQQPPVQQQQAAQPSEPPQLVGEHDAASPPQADPQPPSHNVRPTVSQLRLRMSHAGAVASAVLAGAAAAATDAVGGFSTCGGGAVQSSTYAGEGGGGVGAPSGSATTRGLTVRNVAPPTGPGAAVAGPAHAPSGLDTSAAAVPDGSGREATLLLPAPVASSAAATVPQQVTQPASTALWQSSALPRLNFIPQGPVTMVTSGRGPNALRVCATATGGGALTTRRAAVEAAAAAGAGAAAMTARAVEVAALMAAGDAAGLVGALSSSQGTEPVLGGRAEAGQGDDGLVTAGVTETGNSSATDVATGGGGMSGSGRPRPLKRNVTIAGEQQASPQPQAAGAHSALTARSRGPSISGSGTAARLRTTSGSGGIAGARVSSRSRLASGAGASIDATSAAGTSGGVEMELADGSGAVTDGSVSSTDEVANLDFVPIWADAPGPLSRDYAEHLDASLWGGHPHILGKAAGGLRTTKSFIVPAAINTGREYLARRNASHKVLRTGGSRSRAEGSSSGVAFSARAATTEPGGTAVAAAGAEGCEDVGPGLAGAPSLAAAAVLVAAAAADPVLAHLMDKARTRAAEEMKRRKEAAAAVQAQAAAQAAAAAVAAGLPPPRSASALDGAGGGLGAMTDEERAKERARIADLLFQRQAEDWAKAHGHAPPQRKLAPAVLKVVEQWFEVIDDDRSGALEAQELAQALSAAGVACSEGDVRELVALIDINGDGSVTWAEFQAFLLKEFAAGKNLIGGDYVLPSGKQLPFGAMIARLKRQRVLEDVMAGGAARNRYVDMLYDKEGLVNEVRLVEAAESSLHDPSIGGSSALEALAAGQRARLSLAHSQSTNRRSSMHLSQRHHSHHKLSLHGGSSGNSTGGGGAGGKARSARMSRAERIKSSLAGVVGVGAGPGGSSGGAEVQVQQEGDEDAEWGVTEGGEEGGDAEGPEGGATMYQHRSQAVSVMHDVFRRGPAQPDGQAPGTDEPTVFQLTEVSNIVHEEDEQEQQQPQQHGPGYFPLPLLVPLPAVRRPDTRAFRRALHDVRRSAPAKLMQRFGLPHPKDVAAAASSNVPLKQGLYASPSSASLQGCTPVSAAQGPTDPAALLLPACYSSSSVCSSPRRRRQQQLAGAAAPKLTRRQQQQQPPHLRPPDLGAGARSPPASPLGLLQGTPAPVKCGYGFGMCGWQQQPSGSGVGDNTTSGHGIGPLFASENVHLPSLEREGTTGELHLLPPSQHQQQQQQVVPPPLEQEFSTLTVTASEGGLSGSKPEGSATGAGTARGAHALGCEPSYASLGAVSGYSYLEQYASTSNLPMPHSPYMYGAGNTRYRRWSIQGIDPAHENPNYWQAKAAALLMRQTRRAMNGVPGAGGPSAHNAAAVAAAVAAARSMAAQGPYTLPAAAAVDRSAQGIKTGARAAAASAGGPEGKPLSISLPSGEELLQQRQRHLQLEELERLHALHKQQHRHKQQQRQQQQSSQSGGLQQQHQGAQAHGSGTGTATGESEDGGAGQKGRRRRRSGPATTHEMLEQLQQQAAALAAKREEEQRERQAREQQAVLEVKERSWQTYGRHDRKGDDSPRTQQQHGIGDRSGRGGNAGGLVAGAAGRGQPGQPAVQLPHLPHSAQQGQGQGRSHSSSPLRQREHLQGVGTAEADSGVASLNPQRTTPGLHQFHHPSSPSRGLGAGVGSPHGDGGGHHTAHNSQAPSPEELARRERLRQRHGGAAQVARRPQPQASHLRTSEVSRRRLKPEPPGPVRAAGPVRLPELEQQHSAAEASLPSPSFARHGGVAWESPLPSPSRLPALPSFRAAAPQ